MGIMSMRTEARFRFLNLTQGRILCFWCWVKIKVDMTRLQPQSKSWIPSLLWPCASSTQSPWNKKRLTPFGHLWHLHLLHRPFGLYRPSLQIHSLTSAFRTFLTWNIKGLWDLLDLFEPFEKCGHVEPFGQITKVVISGMHDCPDVTI